MLHFTHKRVVCTDSGGPTIHRSINDCALVNRIPHPRNVSLFMSSVAISTVKSAICSAIYLRGQLGLVKLWQLSSVCDISSAHRTGMCKFCVAETTSNMFYLPRIMLGFTARFCNWRHRTVAKSSSKWWTQQANSENTELWPSRPYQP